MACGNAYSPEQRARFDRLGQIIVKTITGTSFEMAAIQEGFLPDDAMAALQIDVKYMNPEAYKMIADKLGWE